MKAITLIDRRIWGREDLAVFNGSDIPSILVEVGFWITPMRKCSLGRLAFNRLPPKAFSTVLSALPGE